MSTLIVTNVKNTSSATNNIVTNTDGSATIAGASITLGTAVASTSGTSINFTGIPSWVKRITVMFNEVSLSGTSIFLVQLGDSGGVETSGYRGSSVVTAVSTLQTAQMSAGILVHDNGQAAADISSGVITISNVTGNTWAFQGNVALSNTTEMRMLAGAKTLDATLDRVRITTVNGTDTFDAGTINISYE